jgi:hypothetical protein
MGGGGKGGSSGNAQRAVTQQELDLWDSQKKNLDSLTKIAEEQYNLSTEDRNYYEKVFREGTDTEAKTALAKLQSQITGKEVSPESIKSVNIDSLLRDTILNSTPEFKDAASKVIQGQESLTKQYGAEVTGLSKAFTDSIQGFTDKYNQELQTTKEQMGTANADVLARQTGTTMAGISSGYQEARKQLESTLARKGLAGSGVEANILSSNYQQEAMAKASAGVSAYNTAIQQSDALRLQQAQLSGQQYQVGIAGATTGYNANLGATQNIYGVTSASDLQNYNLSNAATLQGIAGLTQVAQAGQGVYLQSANYLQGASSSAANAAQTSTSAATSLANTNSNYSLGMANVASANRGQNMELIGTLAGAGAGIYNKSDERLKTNIQLVDNINGHNIYTWDWKEQDYGYNKGVIAQEILVSVPEAVTMMDNGYYAVNYNMLGLDYLVKGE